MQAGNMQGHQGIGLSALEMQLLVSWRTQWCVDCKEAAGTFWCCALSLSFCLALAYPPRFPSLSSLLGLPTPLSLPYCPTLLRLSLAPKSAHQTLFVVALFCHGSRKAILTPTPSCIYHTQIHPCITHCIIHPCVTHTLL